MLKRIKSILFVFCVVMLFTAQAYRLNDREQQRAPETRPAPVVHNYQSRPQIQRRPQVQNRPQIRTRREGYRQVASQQPTVQSHSQPFHQGREFHRVYAVPAPAPVQNNRLFHRHYHRYWHPRYNFYDDRYHFYPYVNIASIVQLTGAGVLVLFEGQNYDYDQGTFYLLQQGGQYVAVAPPIGIIVNAIPPQARKIEVGGQIYYRYKGVFYIQVAQGFQVIGPVEPNSDGA